jgi:hypothetical protein
MISTDPLLHLFDLRKSRYFRGGKAMLRVLFMTALVFTLAGAHAVAADTTRINFELADNPLAYPGSVATDLYADQGVTFRSAPVISRIGLWPSQVLQQGDAFGGPDPLPRTVLCPPLEIDIAPELRARRVELTVLTRHLSFYSIEAFRGDLSIDRFFFWPPRGFPSPLELERTVVLEASPGEPDITRVVANPGDCFDLMVIDDLVIVGDGPSREPARAYVTAYEINQGVMSRLTLRPRPDMASTPDTRLAAVPSSTLPFVRGRTTVARFFIGSPHREIVLYEPRLQVTIIADDGSSRVVNLRENTVPFAGPVPGSLTVPVVDPALPDDELTRTLVLQRNSIESTADFVIPGAALENARLADLKLFAPSGRQLAWVRATFKGPFSMAFNMVRVQGIGAGSGIGGPVPREPTQTNFRRYFNAIFPVSDLPTLTDLPLFSWGGPGTAPNNCNTLLSNLSAAFASPPSLPSANYQGIIFLASAPPGCGGLGWYNTPGALTDNRSDDAAHEVSHNIGINHASNSHGESAAGGDWEAWPYLHGSIGTANQADRNQRFGVYGVIMQQGDRGGGPWGSWQLGIVAPCGTRDRTRLFPACAEVDGSIVHDYMSYGPRTALPIHGGVKWISDINYHRVYRFLEDCIVLDPPNRFFTGSTLSTTGGAGCTPASTDGPAGAAPAKRGAMPSVEALVISGVLVQDSVESLTVLRRPVVADALSRSSGEYELILLGRDRQERRRIHFDPLPVSPEKDQQGPLARLFRVIVPFEADLGSFTIERQGKLLLQREATTPPTLSAGPLTIKAGWKIGQQAMVTWDVKDNDSQSLSALLLYSPDGITWYPIALVDGRQGKLLVDTSELPPTDRARLYLSLSDGLNAVAAQSELFAVRGRGAEK